MKQSAPARATIPYRKKIFAKLFCYYLDRKAYPQFQDFDDNYLSYQNAYQRYLYKNFAKTVLGKKYGMHTWDKKKLVTHWQEDLPILSGDDYQRDWITHAQHKKNILWPGKITEFSKSSGTTSKGKLIPFTKATKKTNIINGMFLQAMIHHKRQQWQIFAGKHHSLGGTIQQINKEQGYIVGDVSALITKAANTLIAGLLYAYSKETLLKPWSEKSVLYEQDLPQKEISIIYGVTKWEEMLLRRILELHDQKKTNDIKNILQHLEVVVWGGVHIGPFLESFKKMGLSVAENLVGVYNASEGIFGFQAWTDENGGIIKKGVNTTSETGKHATTTAQETLYRPAYGFFAEFAPMECYDDNRTIKKEHYKDIVSYAAIYANPEKWLGKKVGLIVSVPGLLRCPMDMIQIVSVAPFRYTILGRPASINMTGEEVSESHIRQVIAASSVEIKEYTVTGKKNQHGPLQRLEWIVEVSHAICDDPSRKKSLAKELDANLQAYNDDYKTKRTTQSTTGEMRLGAPLIHFVPTGTFVAFDASRNRLGGQNKIPKVSAKRTFVEHMLQWMEKKVGVEG